MKWLSILSIFLFVMTAQAADLVTPKDLTPNQAYGVRSGRIDANAEGKITQYYYQWRDQQGNIIAPYNNRADGLVRMSCYDWLKHSGANNEECTATGAPYECCTGPQAGTCNEKAKNADCTARGYPYGCCTDAGEGICECYQLIKPELLQINQKLMQELEKWEEVQFQ